jgi:hypothetical protein
VQWRGRSTLRPLFLPYSPECVEWVFSEVQIHDPKGPYPLFCGASAPRAGVSLAEAQPTTTEGRMMDDSMYPVDAVRPLARALRSTALSWHDADHRLVEKFAEDMTMQDFIDAAEEQRDRTLREHARMMAAFMNPWSRSRISPSVVCSPAPSLWRG